MASPTYSPTDVWTSEPAEESGDGFDMPELVGMNTFTAQDMMYQKYGLAEGNGDMEIQGEWIYCSNAGKSAFVQAQDPPAGTWVEYGNTYGVVVIWSGCE